MDFEGEFRKEGLEKEVRTKSSERFIFEAEGQVSKSRIGTLEEVRFQLGLSRRKMCQLLLVDPSAWTRWNKPGANAPPHIYRALEWYLLLTEKYPGMGNGFWLSTLREKTTQNAHIQELESRVQQLDQKLILTQGAMLSNQPESSSVVSGTFHVWPLVTTFLALGIGLCIGLLF
ncbi:MAG: hypothetical protein AB7F59_11955 [Bdellovibrionales bacterium]